ncbi:HEAT repeat domain-containing protein [Waterburya agarophytonicola K14]|uniref:HEAT repeat domain-containing protein n=1 Tax=Waterburya agarophytonicola KI4 TaxID=2874699 RepID=A0A964BNX8_9CYAN|nr:HEAT repeat domain-containing protein [Waterburya agarophytonicola]MCC0176589.1 HEAT repeat domain-containing protein [Waterburya agarophytonicola KI4]
MPDTQTLIDAVNKADSADLLLETVENLAEAADISAIPTLVEVLGFNNPGAAVAAVDGLIKIGEPVVPYLLSNLDGYNYGARAWATRVFAGIGDPSALDLLLEAAVSDFSQSVRRSAAKGLGSILWSKLPETEIPTAQQKVLSTLLLATEDGEWVVRYAAIVGLESLARTLRDSQPELRSQIVAKFLELSDREPEAAICARIKYAIENEQLLDN